MCHSSATWHALNSIFPDTNCIVSFRINPYWISNSGIWKVLLETFCEWPGKLIKDSLVSPGQWFSFHVGEQKIVQWCQIRGIWRVINQFKATDTQSWHCNHRCVCRSIVLAKQGLPSSVLQAVHEMSLVLLSRVLNYSQPCLSRSRISRILPKSKVYTRHHSFIFYCFLPHISRIFSKSKLFLQSQEIRLRQGWLYLSSVGLSGRNQCN